MHFLVTLGILSNALGHCRQPRPFKCNECGLAFTTQYNLSVHMSERHGFDMPKSRRKLRHIILHMMKM